MTGVHFNTRSLTGAKLIIAPVLCTKRFQYTLPYGSEAQYLRPIVIVQISIHAPLRERSTQREKMNTSSYFNTRSLTGAKQQRSRQKRQKISIHAPLRERSPSTRFGRCLVFQYTLPYGSEARISWIRYYDISIHAPLRERSELQRVSL